MTPYPLNHDCLWRGPFYIWTSGQTDAAPPPDCKPVYACCICGARKLTEQAPEGGEMCLYETRQQGNATVAWCRTHGFDCPRSQFTKEKS